MKYERALRSSALASETIKTMTIAEVARLFKVTLRTLRFYEDKGLIASVRYGRARTYDVESRCRLKFILKGKRLGFTLSELSCMMEFQADKGLSIGHLNPIDCLDETRLKMQIDHLETQLKEIERAIDALGKALRRPAS